MVGIISAIRYPTKKSLKEALEKGEAVTIEDPSIVAPRVFTTDDIPLGGKEVVTNHPKRSFFVSIERRVDGTIRVV